MNAKKLIKRCAVFFIPVSLIAVAMWLFRSHTPDRPAQMDPLAVEVTLARRGELATYARLEGQIAPFLQVSLSTPQSGNIISLPVREGDVVESGQLLAKIDDRALRAQLVQAQGQLRTAQAQVQGSTFAQPIQSAQYDSSYQTGLARISSDKASLLSARHLYESNQALYEKGFIARTNLEQAESAYVAAQQQLNQDQSVADAARVHLQQSRVDLQTIESNRGAYDQARGQVAQIETQLAQTELHAPFAGIVTARLLDPGAFAGPNQPIVTIAHLQTVYINVNIPDSVLRYIHEGQSVTFTNSPTSSEFLRGVIESVNPLPTQETLMYRARIRYDNAAGKLHGGQLVEVVFPKEFRSNVTIVPRTAIVHEGKYDYVYISAKNRARRKHVICGLETETQREVEGISPGTTVITTRSDALQDGNPIMVVPTMKAD